MLFFLNLYLKYKFQKNDNKIKRKLEKKTEIMENIYKKIVKEKEVKFYSRAAANGISPSLISHYKDGEYITMCTEKYPHTLYDLIQKGVTKERLTEIIDEARLRLSDLHNIGIIHGGLSEENIIINNDVKLIDFGMAYEVNSITHENIENIEKLVEKLYEGVKYADITLTGVDLIKSLEHGILKFILNHYTMEKCKYCNFSFENDEILEEHIIKYHPYCDHCEVIITNYDPEDLFSCDYCGITLCGTCIDNLDYSFYYCEKCLFIYCYYHGYDSGSCKNKRGSCKECGGG